MPFTGDNHDLPAGSLVSTGLLSSPSQHNTPLQDISDSLSELAVRVTGKQEASANLTEFATVNPTAPGLALLDDATVAAQLITLDILTFRDLATLLADTNLGYSGPSTSVVSAGQVIRTSKEGYSYEVASSGASDHHLTVNGVKLYVRTPDSRAWGLPTGGDDATLLNAFFAYISATNVSEATIAGDLSIASGVTLGPASGLIATQVVKWAAKITASTAITKLLTFQNCNHAVMSGDLQLLGTGSTSYSSRTCYHGIDLKGSCGRLDMTGLNVRADRLRGFAYLAAQDAGENFNINRIGSLSAYDCGSGYNNAGNASNLTTTFSARSGSGTSGSYGQRDTLTVAALPPSEITDEVVLGTGAVFAMIDGFPYLVMAVGAGTIDIFPWLLGSATSGNIDYIFGGAIYCGGGDSNNLYAGSVDATRCGIPLGDFALYGASVGVLQTSTVGISHAIGRGVNSACVGGSVQTVYQESDALFEAVITSSGAKEKKWLSVTTPVTKSKIIKLAPRLGSIGNGGVLSTSFSMQSALTYPVEGKSISYASEWETVSSTAFNSTTTLAVADLGDYNEIEVRFEDCTFAAACSLLLRVSGDNGTSYSASGYQSTAANNDVGTTSTTSFALTDGTVTAMPYGIVRLSGFKDSARRVQIDGILGGVHKVGGIWGTATRNSAIQLIFNSQNWTAGNIVIRGLR